jgi:hypothetical protein
MSSPDTYILNDISNFPKDKDCAEVNPEWLTD